MSLKKNRARAKTLPPDLTKQKLALTGQGGVILQSITKIPKNNISRFEIVILAENNSLAITLNHQDLRRSIDKYLLYNFEQKLEHQQLQYKKILSHNKDTEGLMHNSAIDGENLRANTAHIHYLILGVTKNQKELSSALEKISISLQTTPEIKLNNQDKITLTSLKFTKLCLHVCSNNDYKIIQGLSIRRNKSMILPKGP